MKKLFTRVILTLICLIPLMTAIVLYMNTQKSPIESSDLTALVWENPAGEKTTYQMKVAKDKEFIDFLLKLNQNAREVNKLPKELEKADSFKATFQSKGIPSVYRYYFSTVSPSNSYYVDSNRRIYQIRATDTIAFLDSERSSPLYPASKLPVLQVAGQKLTAANIQWTYYTYSGKAHTISQQSKKVPVVSASYVGITLSSSIIPDSSLLTITDDTDQILYQDSLAKYRAETSLKKLIRKDTLLHFTLDTTWEKRDGSRFDGKASYRFDVQTIFDPAANFWLTEQTVEAGEMVVLSGEFVEEITDLSFSSTPSLGIKPTFIRDGDLVRALIPIPYRLALATGTYTLTVTCQGKEYPLTLQIIKPSHTEEVKIFNYSGKLNTHLRTEANLSAFRTVMTSLPTTATLYAKGTFYMNTNETVRAQFGDLIHNTGKVDDQFHSGGVALVAYAGTPILAVNEGMVAKVTTTAYGGKTVIVDHGWGLFSVYYCLGSVNVEEGTYVTDDTVIGYGGNGLNKPHDGYTDGITSYCELWVGGQAISYYSLQKQGIVLTNPQ